ncbi:MAG: hypothetical protein WBB24_14615 [Maribacter sp.]
MKKNLYICLLVLVPFFGIGQDPYLQGDSPEAEKMASALVPKYAAELGMSADQSLQFETKMVEFLIRKEKIKELEESYKKKLSLLTQLSKQETAEMGTILTRPQLRKYKTLKKKYQPVLVVIEQ